MLNRATVNIANKMQFFRPLTTAEYIYTARPKIKHYVVSRDLNSDFQSICDEIELIIQNSQDSIIFLTQKSRIVATAKLDAEKPGRPVTLEEIRRQLQKVSVRTVLKNQTIIPLFRPEPGHVCLTLTDNSGNVEEDYTVSLQPNRDKDKIAAGNAMLYKQLYGEFSGGLFHGKNTSFKREYINLARLIANKNSTIVADITVIPFASSELSREKLMLNITKARSTPLYNLCSTIFKKSLLKKNKDLSIQTCLEEMKNTANLRKFENTHMAEPDEIILAAFACTNAAVEACFGDPHFVSKNVGMDLSTQSAVTLCCAMNLVGEEEFFRFAKNIGFYDESVALIEDLDSDKIPVMKK